MSKAKYYKEIEFLEPVQVPKKEFSKCSICGKNCLSEKQIRTQLNSLKYNRRFKNKVSLRDYFCPFCFSYHLTSEQSFEHLRMKNNATLSPKPRNKLKINYGGFHTYA